MFAQGITAKWELHIPGTYLAEREPDISFPPLRTAVTEGWKVWSEHLYTQSCLQSINTRNLWSVIGSNWRFRLLPNDTHAVQVFVAQVLLEHQLVSS